MLGDLQHYWSGPFLAANAFIGLNLVGALLLGMPVGYKRSYNGHPLLHRLESRPPRRITLDVAPTFQPGELPDLGLLRERAAARGYQLLPESLTVSYANDQVVWRVSVVAPNKSRAVSTALLASEIAATRGFAHFTIAPVRS
ncbi:hypothetical protein [Caldimonas sp. KR1-144]|uniref:hypothetical protein n=1 Tax=Caldimonas sp. KR1-144 TaxID=3400911 RepID=UPI003C0C2216